ncbi:unnamed protein product [Sphagnum troendelagicum]|uniref:RNase III domain-containing protein n=1 Tax=Sphagnum troendelagicum TaxID=128251 RepID=A0ABP0UET2_9BRYO
MAFSSTIWRLSASSYSIASSLCSLFKFRCSRISFSNSISATTSLGNLLSSNKFLRLAATKPLLSVQAVAAASKVATVKTLPKSRPWKPRVVKRPPLDDARFAEKLLSSPQLSLKSLPLLSSCLPSAPLSKQDKAWIEDNLLEAKDALGLASMEAEEGTPGAHLDTLLFLAFQHQESQRAKRSPYVRKAHSRLAFLGQFLLELAFAELFLQMFPRETTACLRERVLGLTHRKVLPSMIKAASMDRLVYPGEDLELLKRDIREPACRSVFWALTGAIYLTLGMPEVYRVLFEVFGMDIDGKTCQPQLRNIQDLDLLSPELDGRRLSWQEICFHQALPGALFVEPRLFRACVPPGMHQFRGNLWEAESLPNVKHILGYPLPVADSNAEVTAARNIELELGLQLCFLHPSVHKLEHPRFTFERLEYLGQKIQDVIMAERLLMNHLDQPGVWLAEKHRRLLINRLCSRYLRDLKLHHYVVYGGERKELFDKIRRMRNFAVTGVSQAIHGLGYAVYGRPEVRRLMFKVFNFEQSESPI